MNQRYMVHESKEVSTILNVVSLVDEVEHKVLKTYKYRSSQSNIMSRALASSLGRSIWHLEQAARKSSVGYYQEKDYINEFCFTLWSWHVNQKVIILEPEALKDVILESFEDNFEALRQLKEAGL